MNAKKIKRNKIRLLLVDDHPIVREGIKSHLSAQDDFDVVADAGNGQDAIRLARTHKPDVVLMDISMPQMTGLEAITRLRRQAPASRILVLTMHENREYIARVLRLGARGYLLKDTAPSELSQAIRLVHQGEVYFSPAASRALAEEVASGGQSKEPSNDESLSDREREVLTLIAEGRSNKEIAQHLSVSVRTVETHRERIMRKLSIRSIAGLTKYAVAHGLVSL